MLEFEIIVVWGCFLAVKDNGYALHAPFFLISVNNKSTYYIKFCEDGMNYYVRKRKTVHTTCYISFHESMHSLAYLVSTQGVFIPFSLKMCSLMTRSSS